MFISNAISYTFTDSSYPIVDTNYLPESHFPPGYEVRYFPNDTSHCLVSPAYVVMPVDVGFTEMGYTKVFKLGIGLTYYNFDDEGESLIETDKLVFLWFLGVFCGPFSPISVPNPRTSQETMILPNPAHDKINIQANYEIISIIITNSIGQVVHFNNAIASHAEINVADLMPGVYIVKINGTEVRKFIKE